MLLFRIPPSFLVVAGLLTSVNAIPVPQFDVFSGTDGFVTTITSQTTTDIVNILTDQSPSTTVLAGPAIGKAAAVIQNTVSGAAITSQSAIATAIPTDEPPNITVLPAPPTPNETAILQNADALTGINGITDSGATNTDQAATFTTAILSLSTAEPPPASGIDSSDSVRATSVISVPVPQNNGILDGNGGAVGSDSPTDSQPATATDASSVDPPQNTDAGGPNSDPGASANYNSVPQSDSGVLSNEIDGAGNTDSIGDQLADPSLSQDADPTSAAQAGATIGEDSG